MRRFVVPGIPFLVSFALSLATAGSHVYWQDSGFFLVAVKELGVLYPPGFVLYVLLCKAWTLMLWWVDFTYAVHLFSATCAALAAGTLAVAVRDLLRTKGPLFHTVQEAGPLAEWVGVCIGCLAASGYTFWAAAILAKVYAFYYLILTLLIWRMIRADESGKPRDFTGVAVLIGLAWQAHPSATNAGLALILFVGFHRCVVGLKGLAWRIGLAAVCAMGPVHLVPILAKVGSSLNFGRGDGFFEYVLGSRFTQREEFFGWEASRFASVGRYAWEEFLGVGLLAIAAGFWRLWRENRRLVVGILTWVLPILAMTVYFRLEGQHDFWMVAAWIPLWMVAGIGLSLAGKGRELAVLLALIGVVWAVVANRKDLDQRDYTLAETYGRLYLDHAAPGAGIMLESDDAQSVLLYLKRIRGVRPDVGLCSSVIQVPHTSGPSTGKEALYLERADAIDFAGIQRGERVPEGPLHREVLRPGEKPDPAVWVEPIPAEDVPKLFRRARGQNWYWEGGRYRYYPEPYEVRLLRTLLLARRYHALALAREGKLAEAANLYESIFRIRPSWRDDASLAYSVAVLYVGLARYSEAEAAFKRILTLEGSEGFQPQIYYFLTGLCGDRPEAAEWKAKALKHPSLPMELRLKLNGY